MGGVCRGSDDPYALAGGIMTAHERNQMVNALFALGLDADEIAYFLRAAIADLPRYVPSVD